MADQLFSIRADACGNQELEGHYISRIGSATGNHFQKQELQGCPVFALGKRHAILRRIETDDCKKAWAICHEFKMETTYYQCITPNCMPPVAGWTCVEGCPPAPNLAYVRYPEAILEFKQYGNEAFQAGDIPVAMEQWERALKTLSTAPEDVVDTVVMGMIYCNRSEAEWILAMQQEEEDPESKTIHYDKTKQVNKVKESLDSASNALKCFEGQSISPLLEKKARHRLVRAQRRIHRWADAAATLRGARVLTLELAQQLLEVEVLDEMTDQHVEWGIKMRFGMTTLKNSSTYLDKAAVQAMSLLIRDPVIGIKASGYILVEKAHLCIRNALLEMKGAEAKVLLHLLMDMTAALGEGSTGTAMLARCCGGALLSRIASPWGPSESKVAVHLLHRWMQKHQTVMKLPTDGSEQLKVALAEIVQFEDDETGEMAQEILASCTC